MIAIQSLTDEGHIYFVFLRDWFGTDIGTGTDVSIGIDIGPLFSICPQNPEALHQSNLEFIKRKAGVRMLQCFSACCKDFVYPDHRMIGCKEEEGEEEEEDFTSEPATTGCWGSYDDFQV